MTQDEQIEELRQKIEFLQLQIIEAIHLAEDSMLPLPSQIERWRNAIGWQSAPLVLKDDEHEPAITGEMRLGGMTPAAAYHYLPGTFYITKISECGDHIIFFCDHNAIDGEELTWTTQDTIIVRGRTIPLRSYPSHRTNWDTFTVHKSDWIHEPGRTPSEY